MDSIGLDMGDQKPFDVTTKGLDRREDDSVALAWSNRTSVIGHYWCCAKTGGCVVAPWQEKWRNGEFSSNSEAHNNALRSLNRKRATPISYL